MKGSTRKKMKERRKIARWKAIETHKSKCGYCTGTVQSITINGVPQTGRCPKLMEIERKHDKR